MEIDKKCIMCSAYFTAKTTKSDKCPRCREIFNKHRRNELTKAKYQASLTAPVMPDGYIYLRPWAESQGHTLKGAQKLVSKTPHIFGAIKVLNPKGGVDVWAVPKDTQWPN